jgi:hypothetical protein
VGHIRSSKFMRKQPRQSSRSRPNSTPQLHEVNTILFQRETERRKKERKKERKKNSSVDW